MSSRSHAMRVRAATRIAVVFAIVVVVSLLSVGHFWRLDLTERKEFTISEASRRLVSGLTDVVNVTVYMSENLPQHLTGFRTRFSDILDEYRAYGGDRLRISYVDPTSDPDAEQKARLLGIAPVQLQALERDRAEVVNAYLGMAVMYEDRQEIIPYVLNLDRLEYDLTSTILKVMSKEVPVIGYLGGVDDRSIETHFRSAADELRKSYEVREIDLAEDPDALDRVTTLVVAGSGEVPDEQLRLIDKFLMRGGRLMLLLDGADIPPTGLEARAARGNLLDFASSYGVTVNNDLVVDRINSNASFQSGFMTMSIPYPYWPKAVAPNISRENPIVSDMDAIAFPWTSSITIADSLPAGVKAEVLARSSGYSWTVSAYANLSPQQRFSPSGPDAEDILAGRGQGKILAVALSGEFPSAFPETEGGDDSGEAEPAASGDGPSTSVPTQILVIGNSRMFEDGFLRQLPGNLVLFLNAVDWLTLGDTLIGIRSRAVEDRPLAELSDAQKATVKFVGTFAVPIGLVAVALGRSVAKRRRRSVAVRATVA